MRLDTQGDAALALGYHIPALQAGSLSEASRDRSHMSLLEKTIVGTSGYSFPDWVGTFYPAGTSREGMFELYARQFAAVELNFTYYRMPTLSAIDGLTRRSPEGFSFWVKANQQLTHEQNRSVAAEFLDSLSPMAEAGKLSGILLQFPQSFHRTLETRQYLAAVLEDLSGPPLAVEFRHQSWADPSVAAGLRARNTTLVIPDVPDVPGLYRARAQLTTRTGYLRLHSRSAEKWHAGMAARYDYDYSPAELTDLADQWSPLDEGLDRLNVFFNNCHRGQAAQNAAAFQKILQDLAKP
jgi:uncharacterized protein YecE (DUF72 family)